MLTHVLRYTNTNGTGNIYKTNERMKIPRQSRRLQSSVYGDEQQKLILTPHIKLNSSFSPVHLISYVFCIFIILLKKSMLLASHSHHHFMHIIFKQIRQSEVSKLERDSTNENLVEYDKYQGACWGRERECIIKLRS